MSLIDLRNVFKVYRMGTEDVVALNDVSLRIDKGEFVSVVGPSGSGKSTLMHLLGCLETPTRGTFHFEGVDVTAFNNRKLAFFRNRRIGFVFQSYNLLPQYSVLQNVGLPLVYAGITGRKRTETALDALKHANITHRNRHRPMELSGGERQRVSIARAIVNSPDIILADEPTGNLDQRVGKEIISLFRSLNQEKGVTIVIVTHDMNVAQVAARRIEILDGRIVNDLLQ
jgi:putative ABC transport system ATP-binding protein